MGETAMSLLESEAHQDERALAPLLRRLVAERERWFFLGSGAFGRGHRALFLAVI
jgi:mannitol-1-phosphate/altronate dehydrogenase